jgi:RimJ/RimL family protein N-acetyltransferase
MPPARPILVELPDQLEGSRVLARRYRDADAAALAATIASAQPELRRWLPGFEQLPSAADCLAGIRQGEARWALREAFQLGLFARDSGALLGDLRLRPTDWGVPAFDIAYWLDPAATGRGYAAEAVRLLVALAFERLAAQRLVICCDQKNQRSSRVPERLGFVLEGCLRNQARGGDGELFDMLVYALTPADFARVRSQW